MAVLNMAEVGFRAWRQQDLLAHQLSRCVAGEAGLPSGLCSLLCSAASAPVVATKGDQKKRGHTEPAAEWAAGQHSRKESKKQQQQQQHYTPLSPWTSEVEAEGVYKRWCAHLTTEKVRSAGT